MTQAKEEGRSKGIDGGHVGTYDLKPILYSIIYDVEFPNGEIRQYSAKIIAENIYIYIYSG